MGGSRAPSDRSDYLRHLLDEFRSQASTADAKRQVLANLANFAYDPANFKHIRDIGVLDELAKQLQNADDLVLVRFASAGICNLCPDPVNASYILRRNCVDLLLDLLPSHDEETQLNSVTSLIYLSEFSSNIKTNVKIIESMQSFRDSDNIRLRNLATIFIEGC